MSEEIQGAAAPAETSTAETISVPRETIPAAATEPTPAENMQAGATPPEFKPSLKYKVMKEEKDFPDWAKPLVTNAEIEKQFQDILSAYDGLPILKQHRETLEGENRQMREQWLPVVQTAQQIYNHIQNKDFRSAFEGLGLTREDIFRYTLNELQLMENPQQLQAHEQVRQMNLQNAQLQQQNQQLMQQTQQFAVQQREFQLETHLQRPELAQVVQAFDARMGTPGAFRAEVIRRGQLYAAQGHDIPVEQAASEVLSLVNWQGASGEPAVAQTPVGTPAAEPKATLPNIRGKGTSPAKRVFKNTDEMRKYATQIGE